MSKLLLYVKGELYQEMGIELPAIDCELGSEKNCIIREEYVRHKKEVMKIKYTRDIIKSGHDYEFVLIVESKMNILK